MCQRGRQRDSAGTVEFLALPSEELKALAVSHFGEGSRRGVVCRHREAEGIVRFRPG